METYLQQIVATHRAAAERDERELGGLVDAASRMDPGLGFASSIQRNSETGLGVIAEVKRRSPSKGNIDVDLDPSKLATAYVEGGAAAVSVLTDEEYFGGSLSDLSMVREALPQTPLLRKDFTVSAADVCDARLAGADAVLLIAAALNSAELIAFSTLAHELRIDVLIEIHEESEIESALAASPDVIGVNQRDLVTFEVDKGRALRLIELLPADIVRIAESGISSPAQAAELRAAGYQGVLVGEYLVRQADPADAVRQLRTSNSLF